MPAGFFAAADLGSAAFDSIGGASPRGSPAPEREPILLAYFDGWSRAELAIEFDAPPGTIRTWMLRGLEQVRECTTP